LEGPDYWDLPVDYKKQPTSDHVAKFHGDRPGKLGDLIAEKEKKKTSTVKHKTAGNYRSRWPNKAVKSHTSAVYTA